MIEIKLYIFFIFAILCINIYIKFRPKIFLKDEGLFIQYTIRDNLGDKETIIKKLM